jgi:hypothetical protein
MAKKTKRSAADAGIVVAANLFKKTKAQHLPREVRPRYTAFRVIADGGRVQGEPVPRLS